MFNFQKYFKVFFGLSGSILIFLWLKSSFFLVVILVFFGVRSGEFGMFWVLCNCRLHAYFLMIFCHIFAQGPFISGGWQNHHFFSFMDQLLKTLFRPFTLTSRTYTFYGGFWGVARVTCQSLFLPSVFFGKFDQNVKKTVSNHANSQNLWFFS